MDKFFILLLGMAIIAALIGFAYYEYRQPDVQIAQALAAAEAAKAEAVKAEAASRASIENTEEYLKFLQGPTAMTMTLASVCTGGGLVMLTAALVVFGFQALTR
jgi:hypothetical protein